MTELLRANLYEFQKFNLESGDEPYFTLRSLKSIARYGLADVARHVIQRIINPRLLS